MKKSLVVLVALVAVLMMSAGVAFSAGGKNIPCAVYSDTDIDCLATASESSFHSWETSAEDDMRTARAMTDGESAACVYPSDPACEINSGWIFLGG